MNDGGKSKTPRKNRAAGIVRIGVSVAILFALFMIAPVGDLFARMSLVSPALWFAVFAGFLGGHALAAAKWRWMIGGAVPYPDALKAHFAGLAANIALPGVAGGDLVRAGLVMKGSCRKTALAVGSLADRLIDTASLLVLAAIGAFWLGARSGIDSGALSIAALGVICAAALSIVFMRPIASLMRKAAPEGKIGRIVGDVADAAEEMSGRPGGLFACLALSLLIQGSFALMNGVIAQNIGAGTSLAAWMFAWPLAKIIATLPISFGGLGVREASLAGLMTPMGYGAAGVIAASLVWESILFAAGAVGAMAQSIGRRAPRTESEAHHG